MHSNEQNRNTPTNSYTTNITGDNKGQVHGGSGNIYTYLNNNSNDEQIPTKEELLSALQIFKQEVEAESEKGLAEEIVDNTIVEIEGVARELKKEKPNSQRIVERLDDAKKVLTAGASVATVAAVSTDKLIPLIEHIIQTVSKIFGAA